MAGNNGTFSVLHIKCPMCLTDINRTLNFSTVSNIKFYEKPSSGSRPDRYVHAEGYDEANRLFSRLYEDALKNDFVCFFFPY
jgi:hypothetical protein